MELLKKTVSGIMLTLVLISALTLAFNIQPAKADGTIYIRADGSIDPPTAPISTLDMVTYIFTDNIYDEIVVQRNNIVIDGRGHSISGSPEDYPTTGIDLSNGNNITIRNTTIKAFTFGIYFNGSSSISIFGNNITETRQDGINAVYSSDIIISGNNITNNTNTALTVNISFNITVSANNIINSGGGVFLATCSNSTISGNKIANNSRGISLWDSSNNTISGNEITTNKYTGLWLTGDKGSLYNSIHGNNITHNYCGVSIPFSPDKTLSYNNKFYHNNFINNTVQVYTPTSDYANFWDDGYPSGGNYWSDYTGVDEKSGPNQDQLGSDGIGDTPYVIDAYNIDHYPLMSPYVPPTYSLTITATADGTTTPAPGTYTYVDGTIVEVTAIPDLGYSLDYWLFDGENRTENPITVVMDTGHTLEAHFVDDIPPEISDPEQDPPSDVQPNQNVTVTANITDYGTGVYHVTLWYSTDNGTNWTPLNMTEISPNTYQATILGFENCTWITYKIVAYDNAGNPAVKDNNGYYYTYHVIPEFPSPIILPLFMLTTLIATILLKKNRKPKFNSILFKGGT